MNARIAISMLAIALLFLLAPLVHAETFNGRIVGLYCAMTQEENCADEPLAPDADFVLLQPDGDYFPLFNIPHDAKVRYALEDVRVIGDPLDKYHAIAVQEIQVRKGDSYETVWSRGDYMRRLERRYGAPAAGATGG